MSHTLSEDVPWRDSDSAKDLGKIYRENIDYVWRALTHLGVHPADVDDVAHDVFLTIKRRLSSFEGRSAFRTWVYGICLRTASDYRGRAFRRREISHDVLPDVPQSARQDGDLDRGKLGRQLAELLDALRPEQRDVFVLYEIEELSMKEIAEAVECPLQTAYSRLHAARARLKEQLERRGLAP